MSMVVSFSCFSESKSTPFTSGWGKFVSFLKSDVLNGVAKSVFIDSSTPRYAAVDLNDWQLVDQLFSISQVRQV
jgi:hypothetical protein